MCIAAAIIGGAVVGAAGTAIAGHEAASATTSSTNAAISAQTTAQGKQQALNAPYAAIGTGGAIQQYENLLGIGGPGQPSPQATLAATPGYQFEKTQGMEGVTNAASAMGLTLSGNTLEGLDKFSTGLADTTFQQAVGNAQNAVSIGQNAAAGTGAGILQTGQGVSNALINQGNTIAGIDANVAAGLTKAIGGGINQGLELNTLQNLGMLGGQSSPAAGAPTIGGQTYPDATGDYLNQLDVTGGFQLPPGG